jgi:DNA repair protein RadC
MRAKHSEKKENLKNIEKLKKRISDKGGEQLADDEFDKIMLNKGNENKNRAGRKSNSKGGVLK